MPAPSAARGAPAGRDRSASARTPVVHRGRSRRCARGSPAGSPRAAPPDRAAPTPAARCRRRTAAAPRASSSSSRLRATRLAARAGSGRAVHSSISGTSSTQSMTWSMKSSRASSAQWISSKTRTVGPGGQRLDEPTPRRERLRELTAPSSSPRRLEAEEVGDAARSGVASDPPRINDKAATRKLSRQRPAGGLD